MNNFGSFGEKIRQIALASDHTERWGKCPSSYDFNCYLCDRINICSNWDKKTSNTQVIAITCHMQWCPQITFSIDVLLGLFSKTEMSQQTCQLTFIPVSTRNLTSGWSEVALSSESAISIILCRVFRIAIWLVSKPFLIIMLRISRRFLLHAIRNIRILKNGII